MVFFKFCFPTPRPQLSSEDFVYIDTCSSAVMSQSYASPPPLPPRRKPQESEYLVPDAYKTFSYVQAARCDEPMRQGPPVLYNGILVGTSWIASNGRAYLVLT